MPAPSQKRARIEWLLLGGLLGALVAAPASAALRQASAGFPSRSWLAQLAFSAPGSSQAVVPPPRVRCPPPSVCPPLPTAPDPRALLRPPWQAVLTDEDLNRSLSYVGSGRRLRRVAAKLLAGEPIKAYALGGSVTLGVGASSRDANYVSRFWQLINASFPHRDHVFSNKGIGGSGSGIYAACLERMLPPDTDLVVVEFSANEPALEPFTSPARRRYEQLLRKLLRLGSPGQEGAAVIVLHHYSWRTASGDGVAEGSYYATSEAQLGVFANYYDLPQVSVRNGLWPLMAAGVDGFKVDKVRVPNVPRLGGGQVPIAAAPERALFFYLDQMHPADGGHKAMAEALAAPLRRALAEKSTLPPPSSHTWGMERLPPPMVPGTAEVPTTLCAMQEDFKAVVVRHSPGFAYRPERPGKPTFVEQKWGWTALQPGEWAELQFDTRDVQPPSATPHSAPETSVSLVYLRSYEHMGVARVQCVSGCRCRATRIDGTWARRVSLMQHHAFKVTQNERCVVRVTALADQGSVKSDGHKVTLMAVIVTGFPLHLGKLSTSYELAAKHAENGRDH